MTRPRVPRIGVDPIEDVIAYLRASSAAADAITDRANRAFDVAFRKAMREGRS